MKTKNTTNIYGVPFNTTGLFVAFTLLVFVLFVFAHEAIANTEELKRQLGK